MPQLLSSFRLLNLGCRSGVEDLNLCLPEFRNQYLKSEKHFSGDLHFAKRR